ncbi:GIY-YIG nuclease family protein [Tsukamurella ocularis]|uniref:GIY-YIG nuclease family protein n=1 Tax=Tsukamurella ocularis TaxID=1970234 RepID=UPI0039EE1A5C
MFGTIIWDVFSRADAGELRDAIDDLASPTDQIGWSSAGVYAFYDPELGARQACGGRIKYVGLAVDLSDRFAQHNGIKATRAGSSKREKIEDWFRVHEYLGYSAFVQTPLHQAHNSRFNRNIGITDWIEDFEYDAEAREAIALIEGQLIQSGVLDEGSRPEWNKIGGLRAGQNRAAGGSGMALLRLLDGTEDSLFVARRSIRQLAADSAAYFYESDILHTARVQALIAASEEGASNGHIMSQLDRMARDDSPWSANGLGSHICDQISRMRDTGYLASTTRK